MNFFALKLISRLLNLLPQKLLLAFGDALGLTLFFVIRFRRKIVLENLRLAFGPDKTESELLFIARENYRHYGRVLFEVLQSVVWKPADYLKHVTVEGIENVRRIIDRGEGGFFLTSHMGNWELEIGAAAAAGIPLDVVVKHARNPKAEEFLKWYRAKTGAGIFLESGTAKDILRSAGKKRFVAFILDQFMGPPIGLPVTFFGQRAGTAAALALLTEKRAIPIVPAYSYRDNDGRLHTVFEPELQMPKFSDEKNLRLFEKTQFFNDVLEQHVRDRPSQWLWIHRRWKAYRGVPRWMPESFKIGLVAVSLFGFSACTTPGNTPTGIALPPDAKIAVPEFKPEVTAEEIKPTEPAPPPEPEKKVVIVKKRRKQPLPKTPVKAELPAGVGFHVVRSDKIPFEIGEHMEIDLNWLALPAGKAILEVREGEIFNGRPTFKLWGNALSSKLVDAIYHIDNTIESFIDKSGLIPYKFLLHMVETQQIKETRVSFDHTKNKAYYWAKRISKRWGDQDIDRADDIYPQAHDMFSALYYARVLNYQMGVKQSFPIYENAQNLNVELVPVANEFLNTKVGAFQCWKVLVTVKINNVLRPTGDIFLWVSDDSKKYIVKFDAKLKIGSLIGNLTALRERK